MEHALRREARRRQILQLVNDDRRSQAQVTFSIERVDAELVNGDVQVTQRKGALSSTAAARVPAGQLIQFIVENTSRVPLYVSLLSMSPDGEIAVLYPHVSSAADENKIAPGARVALPDAQNYSVWMLTGPPGRNVMKIVATEEPIDLRGLNMAVRRKGSVSGVRGHNTPLGQMLAKTVSGTRAAGSAFKRESMWGTRTVLFDVIVP